MLKRVFIDHFKPNLDSLNKFRHFLDVSHVKKQIKDKFDKSVEDHSAFELFEYLIDKLEIEQEIRVGPDVIGVFRHTMMLMT